MKKTRLRRKSKSEYRRIIDKADRALQDWYRRNWAGMACESCGGPFDLMHHFIEKSRSSRLRYDVKNLIFLCQRCHSLHHQFHDASIAARIIRGRGMRWLNWLLKAKEEYAQLNTKIAEKVIKKYEEDIR